MAGYLTIFDKLHVEPSADLWLPLSHFLD